MAKANRSFLIRELYESLGIYQLPPQDQDKLNTLLTHWRVHYQTKDGRLGSDLVNYHDAEADLNTMAQQFLDHNSNGLSYWRYDEQKVKYDKDADEIKRLLGQVFCQKNANAAKNARQKDEGNRIRRNVAPVLPTVSDVAAPDTTQPQDQSGEMSNDDDSYSKGAKYDDRHDTPRRSTRKRTPSIWMDDSEKRLKLAQPQSKPPAATEKDISTPRTTEKVAPYSTRLNSPDWQSELLPQLEMNTVDDVMHQRGGTDIEGNDQTPKPKASTTFMVLTRTPRRKIKTYWAEGSLTGKTLRDIFHETEALVGRFNTEEISFELKGSQTGHRYRIPAGDQKAFEHMRRAFNHEAKHELKKGHCEFEIWLELIGGTEHGDDQTDNEIDEKSEAEEIF